MDSKKKNRYKTNSSADTHHLRAYIDIDRRKKSDQLAGNEILFWDVFCMYCNIGNCQKPNISTGPFEDTAKYLSS